MPHVNPADGQDEGGFPSREIIDGLIGRDAVFVQAARFLSRFENRGFDAGQRELVRAGEARGAGADDGHFFSSRRAALVRRFARLDQRVGGVALQLPDHHRLAFGLLPDAGLLAKRLSRAYASAYAAQDICVEDRFRCADAVSRGDLTDEQRNVDRSRTGLLTGRIVAEIAPLRLDPSFVRLKRRMQIGKIRFQAVFVEPTGRDVGSSGGKSWRTRCDRHGVSLARFRAARENSGRMVS